MSSANCSTCTSLLRYIQVFTYRYFLHRWPNLCVLAVPTAPATTGEEGADDKPRKREPVGCIVCKIDVEGGEGESPDLDIHSLAVSKEQNEDIIYSGYIGMLAVQKEHRRFGLGTALIHRAIYRMKELGCESIKLETEASNTKAMSLYENKFGFIREELLKKYYLNWGDAYRLRLWFDTS